MQYNKTYKTLTNILAGQLEMKTSDPKFEEKAETVADTNPIVKQIQVLREQMKETAQAEYAKAKIEVTKLFRDLAHAITEVIHYASEAGEDTRNLEKVSSQLIKLKTQANLDVSGLTKEEPEKDTMEINEPNDVDGIGDDGGFEEEEPSDFE